MAIQIPTGEYVTVEDISQSFVTFRMYKDAEQRKRYKDGTVNKYEWTQQDIKSLPVDLNIMVDSEKSLYGNLITAGYVALKTLPQFSEAIDI